ncbi:MAG: DUF1775 domain-containing protein [Microbacterium sp.]|uniref:DUF1775 domain-containing protein n=1 Tax=Microbacterium sp. TaxID=51671 RepID=UPI0026342DA9|nr:DUF1775 domain-containing protein [Microbacterium sp.]MCX6501035.1 DUF1775 domain-containing protein [Microbacterium sp.]
MSVIRPRLLAGATAAGIVTAALVLAAPLAASAHVTVTPDTDATAGGHGVLTVAFSHGCEDSPTTAMSIDIPAGIAAVAPTLTPGWQIAVTREGGDGMVQNITYTADEPVPSGIRAALDLGVTYAADAAGQTLVFPVVQTCVTGQTAWTEVAAKGADAETLDAPAPTVTVGAAAGEEHGHTATAPTDADASEDGADVSATAGVWLGAGGLALGAAGLVAAVVALRRSRS